MIYNTSIVQHSCRGVQCQMCDSGIVLSLSSSRPPPYWTGSSDLARCSRLSALKLEWRVTSSVTSRAMTSCAPAHTDTYRL